MKKVRIFCSQTLGIKAEIINVETHIVRGLNSFSIIGLGDKSVTEAKDRVSASINSIGLKSPKQKNQKTIISLSPAHIRKEGTSFDLSIAISYLIESGDLIYNSDFDLSIFCHGELGLDGEIKESKGLLQGLYEVEEVCDISIIPKCNVPKNIFPKGIKIIQIDNIREILTLFKNNFNVIESFSNEKGCQKVNTSASKWNELKDLDTIKSLVITSVIGRLNVGMYGPPGIGKSAISKELQYLLPYPSPKKEVEVRLIYSSLGLANPDNMIPYRKIDKNITQQALLGGGKALSPGEVTLAHNGILHIDEFLEYPRNIVESLKDPVENKMMNISRSIGTLTYPCNFLLITTMNSCLCSKIEIRCVCSYREKIKYRTKISEAMKDRIPMWLNFEKINTDKKYSQYLKSIFRDFDFNDLNKARGLIMNCEELLSKIILSDEESKKIRLICLQKGYSERSYLNIKNFLLSLYSIKLLINKNPDNYRVNSVGLDFKSIFNKEDMAFAEKICVLDRI